MTNRTAETIAYNRAAIARMRERQNRAAVTGATCPRCGRGVNPTILKAWGHCIQCQNRAVMPTLYGA